MKTLKEILNGRCDKDFDEEASLENRIEDSPIFFRDIISNIVHIKDIEKDDPINPLDVDISDYLHIEEGKWEITGHRFDKDPIYDTDD